MPTIDQIVEPNLTENGPGMAIAVIQNGEVLHRQGYGLANIEWQISVQADTVFRLASITKQFTATAIMMLVEAGKLSLDDLLTQYLPDYPTSGHEITIRQLLNHTSGIKSYTGIEGWYPDRCMVDMTPETLCDAFKQIPIEFKPGSQFSYNNSGYHLLGMIIERIADCTYEAFIHQHIFEPLGMTHSYYLNNGPIIPNRASGYHKAEAGFENAPYISMTQPYAAGSLGSTIDDLMLWDQALAENKLISQESFNQMITPTKLDDGSTVPYGFGLDVPHYYDYRLAKHDGGIYGFNTLITRFLDEGLTIILLANFGTNLDRVMRQIARPLLNLPALDYAAISVSETELKRICGKYLIYEDHPIEIIIGTDEALYLRDGDEDKPLVPLSETRFCFEIDPETELHFSDENEDQFDKLTFVSPFSRDEALRAKGDS